MGWVGENEPSFNSGDLWACSELFPGACECACAPPPLPEAQRSRQIQSQTGHISLLRCVFPRETSGVKMHLASGQESRIYWWVRDLEFLTRPLPYLILALHISKISLDRSQNFGEVMLGIRGQSLLLSEVTALLLLHLSVSSPWVMDSKLSWSFFFFFFNSIAKEKVCVSLSWGWKVRNLLSLLLQTAFAITRAISTGDKKQQMKMIGHLPWQNPKNQSSRQKSIKVITAFPIHYRILCPKSRDWWCCDFKRKKHGSLGRSKHNTQWPFRMSFIMREKEIKREDVHDLT